MFICCAIDFVNISYMSPFVLYDVYIAFFTLKMNVLLLKIKAVGNGRRIFSTSSYIGDALLDFYKDQSTSSRETLASRENLPTPRHGQDVRQCHF